MSAEEHSRELEEAIELARANYYGAAGDEYRRNQPIASDADPDSCIRRQVLEIVKPEAKEKFTADLRERFEAGNRAERDAVEYLSRIGLRVVEQQSPFELRHQQTGEKVMGGKIDGILLFDVPRGAKAILEAKLVQPWTFDRLSVTADFSGSWFTRKHLVQLNIYMLGKGLERGVFLLTDGRRRKAVQVALDLELAERTWRFAEDVVDAVKAYRVSDLAGTTSLPEFTKDLTQCARCPFYARACQPPGMLEGGAEWVPDPELEAELERREQLRAAHREYEGLDRRIKIALRIGVPKKAGTVVRRIVGAFAIEIAAKEVRAEAKARDARVDLVVDVERIGAPADEQDFETLLKKSVDNFRQAAASAVAEGKGL